MGTVIYHSIDFDGCISNESSARALGKDWVKSKNNAEANEAYLKANSQFIESLKRDEPTVLVVGSNRQIPHIDFNNGTGTTYPPGSVFPRLEAIAQTMGEGTQFDPFLLPDLELEKGAGQTYKEFREKGYLNDNGSYKDGIKRDDFTSDGFKELEDDESKASLLFAQMQHAATQHPNDAIEFNFYDDRKDIVEALNAFFKAHPELIPKNVTLNLVGYAGPELTQEDAQELLTHYVLHTTTDLGSNETKAVMEDAERNNFPLIIKSNAGEQTEFKIYRRQENGEWGFAEFDGTIPGMSAEDFSGIFPSKAGDRMYPSVAKNPEVITYLNTQHFYPIPESRKGSKPVYPYGAPKSIDLIQGIGDIPTSTADWMPIYQTMRQASMDPESPDKMHVSKHFTLVKYITALYSDPDVTPPQKAQQFIINKLCHLEGGAQAVADILDEAGVNKQIKEQIAHAVLTALHRQRVVVELEHFLSTEISAKALNLTRTNLAEEIKTTLDKPNLTIEDCKHLEKILQHANVVLDPTATLAAKNDAMSNLGQLSDDVVGRKSEVLQAVSTACYALAIVAAIVALVLAPTGVGFILGMAVAGALSLAGSGAEICAEHTKSDLSKKTLDFKHVLEEIKEHSTDKVEDELEEDDIKHPGFS